MRSYCHLCMAPAVTLYIRRSLTSSALPRLTVVHGDSTQAASYTKLGLGDRIGHQLADVLITDPPYCLLNRRRKGGDLRDQKKVVKKIDNQPTVPRYENLAEYKTFTKQWLYACTKYGLKPAAPLVIWTNALGKAAIVSVCKELSYNLRGEYLWAKRTSDRPVAESSTKNEVLLRVYETALVFQHSSVAPITFLEVSAQQRSDAALPWAVVTGYHDTHTNSNMNDSSDVLSSSSSGGSNVTVPHLHPCHKPLASLEPLIHTWSAANDLVLDPFSGSGGIASAVLKVGGGRRVAGIEVIEEWARYAGGLLNNNSR